MIFSSESFAIVLFANFITSFDTLIIHLEECLPTAMKTKLLLLSKVLKSYFVKLGMSFSGCQNVSNLSVQMVADHASGQRQDRTHLLQPGV